MLVRRACQSFQLLIHELIKHKLNTALKYIDIFNIALPIRS